MNTNNLSKSSQVYDLLKKGLDASSMRSKAISNNIANINTKGYKKYLVSFEENLQQSIDYINMKTTESKHINDSAEEGEVKLQQDLSSSMREDGNNVDIDNEMANQAANNLMYNALITQVNSKIALQRYIVNEGRR
jgi:flagellar basal-body rod protein FlgB